MIPLHIFFEEEYLGAGFAQHPTSYHYFCRVCGKVWCRAISARQGEHTTLIGNCPEHHRDNWSTPIICIDIRFNTIKWPKEALLRDFLYLMDLKFAPVINHNLPENSHDQHKAA